MHLIHKNNRIMETEEAKAVEPIGDPNVDWKKVNKAARENARLQKKIGDGLPR